tara:strand:- start:357 stop:590 length:234 start_codon:yes stop_codon:yes gene_type:complete
MKLIKSKFSDRHRPKRKLWQNKLRSDLKEGVHRPMFPNDNNDAMKYKELKEALVGDADYTHQELIERALQLVDETRR